MKGGRVRGPFLGMVQVSAFADACRMDALGGHRAGVETVRLVSADGFGPIGGWRAGVDGTYASAVVGSMMDFTSATELAGKPPCVACSRTSCSLGAM
jgi:hypothetical protein